VNPWTWVVMIALASFVAVAIGFDTLFVGIAGELVTFAAIVLSIGDLGKSEESTAMAIGFGVMLMIPAAPVTLLAVALGQGARRHLARHDLKPLGNIGPSPIGASRDEAVALALAQFRRGSAIRIRCPSCRRGLTGQRVLSSLGRAPDIELACACGACGGVHPFQAGGDALKA
jgi:hypothetical protein